MALSSADPNEGLDRCHSTPMGQNILYCILMMASQDGGRKQVRSLLGLVWRVYLNKLQKDPLLTKVRWGLAIHSVYW